jgi:hypothetical protein
MPLNRTRNRPTVERICEHCARPFPARLDTPGRFCSRLCVSRALSGEGHPSWKGDEAKDTAKRIRAGKLYPLDACEGCGEKATEHHHVDGNTGDNRRSNVRLLCRRCHVDAHMAMGTYLARAPRPVQPPKPCTHCGRLYKPRRRGLCGTCAEYQRRHAASRPLPLNTKLS